MLNKVCAPWIFNRLDSVVSWVQHNLEVILRKTCQPQINPCSYQGGNLGRTPRPYTVIPQVFYFNFKYSNFLLDVLLKPKSHEHKITFHLFLGNTSTGELEGSASCLDAWIVVLYTATNCM